MSLETRVMEAMKVAMKSKDTATLDALRAIKSAILLAATQSGGKRALTEAEEAALLQKLIKQRVESAGLYEQQGRTDLAEPERAQAAVIQKFLPEPLSVEAVRGLVVEAIAQTGAKTIKDMGAVMNWVTQKAAGRADGKTIAALIKEKLT